MPVGHFLPISKHFDLLSEQIDESGHFIVNGSREQQIWREEHEINEISVEGDWVPGDIDNDWMESQIAPGPEGEEEA